MSIPQLWTNIRIQLHFDLLSQAELLRLSLKLSGSLPLHIQAALPDGRKKLPKEKEIGTCLGWCWRC